MPYCKVWVEVEVYPEADDDPRDYINSEPDCIFTSDDVNEVRDFLLTLGADIALPDTYDEWADPAD